MTQAQLLSYASDLRRAVGLERQRRRELESAYVAAVAVLASAVEARDPYTGGHAERVATYAVTIAQRLGWSDGDVQDARMGGLLHDIGKLGVNDAILRKPGRLEAAEYAQIQRHPELGAQILGRAPFLSRAVVYAHRHHERWDGGGYPSQLAGSAIPIGGRLMAIADAFDAMTSNRPYRRAMDLEQACGEIRRNSGTQFDPDMAQAFLEAVRDGALTIVPSAWTARTSEDAA